ncbi:alpha/beta hydrolase [Oculatella sp. LEGE 06141]|uniref:alpha/beta fold hydrolase n=1 Tax=Oculatella sp. LEGE 06141 TaxID=1828648 RepID=UPI001881700B|nr:alpha/beta hydrolase [Oculatella sp. LEGE 06141]MBE9181056.1 alpha/beta hydrolase [Oculatella sp. LEGE 06141]
MPSQTSNQPSDQVTARAPIAPTQFYTWRDYRCAYEVRGNESNHNVPLLLIHPVGVGLSRRFWDRFNQRWLESGQPQPIYNPDLLGCGESAMPHVAYTPDDWAAQLQHFLNTVIQKPAIVVAQGALFPVAIALVQRQPDLVKALILAGPPAWPVMTRTTPTWQQKLSWNLFDSPLGSSFYRYARRRQFLQSFSEKQLFADRQRVDSEWLDTLKRGADDPASRHAVFSFLAGFWRKNYESAIAHIQQPTLVVLGNTASSISRSGKSETPDERMADYLQRLPAGEGIQLSGRNVLPYESTAEFVEAIVPFVTRQGTSLT